MKSIDKKIGSEMMCIPPKNDCIPPCPQRSNSEGAYQNRHLVRNGLSCPRLEEFSDQATITRITMDTLPPTRNVELLVSSLDVPGPCCACRTKDGVRRCSRCKAVRYCGQECQKKGRKDHKRTCNAINQLLQETMAAIDLLANPLGGTAALLESPLVKQGVFTFHGSLPPELAPNIDPGASYFDLYQVVELYVMARWKLVKAYAKCGQETLSRLAFQLATENFLDLLCLSRQGPAVEELVLQFHMHKSCSWMVSGDKDQLALNFLCYLTRRVQAPHPFPYLDMPTDEDIEEATCISIVQEKSKMWFQTFMLISLIKFKRLQALVIQSRAEEAGWNAFMEGSHPVTGASSVVFRLDGVALVLEKLKGFVVDQSLTKRVELLANQINGLLMTVNERNPKLIPGIIDRETLEDPTFPDRDEREEFECHYEYSDWFEYLTDGYSRIVVERDIHAARYAVNNYGHAWHKDRKYVAALRLFLDTGQVTSVSEEDATL